MLWVTSICTVAGAHPVNKRPLYLNTYRASNGTLPRRGGWLGRGRVGVIGSWRLWRAVGGRRQGRIVGGWGLWGALAESRILPHWGLWGTLTWCWFWWGFWVRGRLWRGGLWVVLYSIPPWWTRSRGRWAWLRHNIRTRGNRRRIPMKCGGLWGLFWGLIRESAAA